MPLGNGMIGALVWQKGDKLRFSLDRADLWDERPAIDFSKFNFRFVQQQVKNNTYDTIHKLGDDPYESNPHPTKIPAGSIEFNTSPLGAVKQTKIDIETAICTVEWQNGTSLQTFVTADKNIGFFRFNNLTADIQPDVIAPPYNTGKKASQGNSVEGLGLESLGYDKGTIKKSQGQISYYQPVDKNRGFTITIKWVKKNNVLTGSWVVSEITSKNNNTTEGTYDAALAQHIGWWKNYWQQSAVKMPDPLLQKQYYLEMYKLGCVARKGAPAITLQAVWTADNGNLPPWKGDFHHDLNTELSYWPSYAGNHLEEAASYTDWLWKIRDENKKLTKQYFGVDGLNVPGVTTLDGVAMGGWIQYSLSPSTASWLAQHFYWQWKYSMDEKFLKDRLYPYIHEVATFIENITFLQDGKRVLPLSSSPEYHDNSIKAWFKNYTNYDLALYKYALSTASEVAVAMNKPDEAKHWKAIYDQLPAFDVNETGLTIAPGQNLDESHRHHAQLMAIYPLGLLDVEKPADRDVMEKSLHQLEKMGTRAWCGYSFGWAACIYAKAKQADSAVNLLRIFASNFCSTNSFHLNGDQKGGQYSNFTYRPFTLEGNFAFAQGVHELLLQSNKRYIEIFPAVPQSWKDISFKDLRAEGAYVVSAVKENGVITQVKIKAEKDGQLRIKRPFPTYLSEGIDRSVIKLEEGNLMMMPVKKGQVITFKNAFE